MSFPNQSGYSHSTPPDPPRRSLVQPPYPRQPLTKLNDAIAHHIPPPQLTAQLANTMVYLHTTHRTAQLHHISHIHTLLSSALPSLNLAPSLSSMFGLLALCNHITRTRIHLRVYSRPESLRVGCTRLQCAFKRTSERRFGVLTCRLLSLTQRQIGGGDRIELV